MAMKEEPEVVRGLPVKPDAQNATAETGQDLGDITLPDKASSELGGPLDYAVT